MIRLLSLTTFYITLVKITGFVDFEAFCVQNSSAIFVPKVEGLYTVV